MGTRPRDPRKRPWSDGVIQDARYALKGLGRSLGFTVTAVTTLAVGIGVNAAVFAVTNAVLFAGFPLVRENDRLLYITTGNPGCCVSFPDYQDWRAQTKSFEDIAVVRGELTTFSAGSAASEEVHLTHEVSANTFSLLGVKPVLGRDFVPADMQPDTERVAVLNYDFWQSRFAGDPSIIGRTITRKGVATTVVGVMPDGFSFPENPDLWVALVPDSELRKRDARQLWFAVGRMTSGATIESARAEMDVIGRGLGSAYPDSNQGRNLVPHLQTFDTFFMGASKNSVHKAMWGAIGFVLLIASANLANLLLIRTVDRSREIAIRGALGAGRWRIIRQLLVECAILLGLGGVLGWWLGRICVWVYESSQSGEWATRTLDYSMGSRALVYVLGITIMTGVLFSLAPAVSRSRLRVYKTLRDGTHVTGGAHRKRLSSILVAVQMALAVALLSGAGLLVRSFMNVDSADVGVRTANVLTASIPLPTDTLSSVEAQRRFEDRLKTRLEGIPGIESVAFSLSIPTGIAPIVPYELAEEPIADPQSVPTVARVVISPDYFDTLGARVLYGRSFSTDDRESSRSVAIVNERFANQHWQDQSAVGRRIRLYRGSEPGEWLTVVGVVSNIVQNDRTRQSFQPLLYVPVRQSPTRQTALFVTTLVPPDGLAPLIRQEIAAINPERPAYLLSTLADNLRKTSPIKGGIPILFVTFASIALAFASIGLYATVARSVTEQTREIGIRTAIGASKGHIRRLVFAQGLVPLAFGLAAGLASALAVNRVLRAELVGVEPTDPVTLSAACAVLVLAGILGCVIPARRAMKIDPVTALRHD